MGEQRLNGCKKESKATREAIVTGDMLEGRMKPLATGQTRREQCVKVGTREFQRVGRGQRILRSMVAKVRTFVRKER